MSAAAIGVAPNGKTSITKFAVIVLLLISCGILLKKCPENEHGDAGAAPGGNYGFVAVTRK